MTGTFQSDKGGTSIPLLSHPGEEISTNTLNTNDISKWLSLNF